MYMQFPLIEGIAILNEDYLKEESIQKLKLLLHHIENYIQPGDYFELFSSWVGEESDKSEGSLTIQIDELNLNAFEIPEKTVVTFQYCTILRRGTYVINCINYGTSHLRDVS